MSLVAYTDSDDSDNSLQQPKSSNTPTKPRQITSATKPAFFRKLVDSDSHKIRVDLNSVLPPSGAAAKAQAQSSDHDDNAENVDTISRSPKKRRLGDRATSQTATATIGFNAMLPAPKNTGSIAKKAGEEKARARTREVGFTLKTGSEPAFSRESVQPVKLAESVNFSLREEESDNANDNAGVQSTKSSIFRAADEESTSAQPSVKTTKSTIFKPLSVARRKPPKRKTATSSTRKYGPKITGEQNQTGTSVAHQIDKPRVPLFSLTENAVSNQFDTVGVNTIDSLAIETSHDGDNLQDGLRETLEVNSQNLSSTSHPFIAKGSSTSLLKVAEDLNLPKSARRQLFGRNHGKGGGASDTSAINIVNFNTDSEYAANEELRAAGETVQHNPVRSIAPGKHSLKQLLSAATNQQDALEEHFASGRRNRKEAGGKYGW